MRKVILPLVSAMLLASASVAFAASASGTIKSIDQSSMRLTLDNGQTFSVPASVDVSKLKEGQKVNVTYSEENGQMKASEVTPQS
jgi:Cu/Ag efflux protein CusF